MVAKPLDEEAIFKIAAGIPSADTRSDYLQQVCRDDDALLNRVLTLLRAHDNAPNFLEFPPPGICPTGEPASVTGSSGAQIGPYKLREQIGEGGMGMVYVAEQTEPVRRRVALKIIKPGMATKDVVARFEAERQALAMMDHPNIARVFDGGATDNGQPFFVMELVLGVPITEHCDEARLTTEERIELFIDVCHAVQHAHQQGIIHRDIKPGNVMVTVADGRLIPKVIDFGIAKATQKRLTERTSLTSDGQFLGTPQYMSPEQAGMSDLHVDIRTDVYSLGVLLYELLVSNTPFDPKRLREASYDEICRIIRDTDPPTPSKQLSTLGAAAAEETSKQRKVPPNVLQKQLRGDLDCIVMKTLEKDRDRRYDTAEALADDLRRFLDDKPIEAKRPTRTERVAKWSRRHRWGVATSVAVALAALLGGLVLAWYGQRREAEQRVRAEKNLLLAFDATDQLYGEFAQGGGLAESEEGRVSLIQFAPKQIEYLKKLLAFYDSFTRANDYLTPVPPEIVRAYARMGSIHSKLGDDRKAQAALNKAMVIAKDLGDQFLAKPENRRCLAEVHSLQSGTYTLAGKFKQAVAELTEAIRIDPKGPHVANSYTARARAYRMQGDLALALADVNTAIRLKPKFALAINVRGMTYAQQGDLDRAIADFKEVIRLTPKNIYPLNNLGFAYRRQGNIDAAIRTFGEAIAIDPENPISYFNRANAYLKIRAFDKAIADCKKTIRIDPQRADSYNTLATVYFHKHDFERVIDASNKALRIDPTDATAYNNLGAAHREIGALDQAITDLNQAYRYAPKSPWVYVNRGAAYTEKGAYDQAIADLSEAIRLKPDLIGTYSRRAGVYMRKHDYAHAVADFSEQIRREPNNPLHYSNRGLAYQFQGDLDLALADFNHCLELAPGFLPAHCNRGDLYRKEGDFGRALHDYNQGIRLAPKDANAYCSRGEMYMEQGELDKGVADLTKAVELKPRLAVVYSKQALALLATGEVDRCRAACAQMLDRYVASQKADDQSWTAWTCALAPHTVDDFAPAIALATKALATNPKSIPDLTTLGALLYRAGRIDDAIAHLAEADRLAATSDPPPENSPIRTWYFLAMAHQAAGHADQAQQWLAKAVKATDEKLSVAQQDAGSKVSWNRRLTLRLLREEAEQRLVNAPDE